MRIFKDSVSIVLAGEAGQGIQLIEAILTSLLKRAGYHVFATKDYMSRVRGGVNSTEIRVSAQAQPAFVERIDILLPLTAAALPHLGGRIAPDTIIIGERERIAAPGMIDVPFTRLATEAGGAIMANTLAAGVVAGLIKLDPADATAFIQARFSHKSSAIQEGNRMAFARGFDAGSNLARDIVVDIRPDAALADRIMLTGNEAVALGAIAGGVNYVCAYPMSPGTPVLELMAEYSRKFDILVEQVEDEVGVVNMALGAWYAGARALVTTSGGGFALMTEGVSLAGMAELPLVVHIAQRPGPATGLPTRTEQGDLFLAAFAGHGEFARLVLAPGNLQEAFDLGRSAIEWADRYQAPVFLLTDQYLLESYYDTPVFDPGPEPDNLVTETSTGYHRFRITESGISPRGIPGWGQGAVVVDSDEHDETGHITESMEVREAMVARRQRKIETLRAAMPLPEWIGPPGADTLVLGWGSTRNSIAAALGELGSEAAGVAQLHFSWVWPLPEGVGDILGRANRLILVENNETGQLGRLLRMETGVRIDRKILKSNGMPFSVEELVAAIGRELA